MAEAEGSMRWSASAERTLKALTEMVPATRRELAAASARDESELVASERGADEVAGDDVVRGWIHTTPPDQRDGLVAVIDDLGYDVELFADDLQSEGDWEDDVEEPEPDGM
jgi:hypothetical protein